MLPYTKDVKNPESSLTHKTEIQTSMYNNLLLLLKLCFEFTATNLLDSLLMVPCSTLLRLDMEYTRKTTFDRRKAGMSHIDMEWGQWSHLDSSNQVCISLKIY